MRNAHYGIFVYACNYHLLHVNFLLINIDFHFRFGQVSSDFRMDNVRCSGTESNIFECPLSRTVDCGGNQGAGVVCVDAGKETNTFQYNF